MAAFLTGLAVYGGLLLLASAPLLFMTRRLGRPKISRGFLMTAAVVAVLSAATAAGSAKLVAQCEAVGNSNCIDSGGAGFQLLLVGGYAVIALTTAVILYRE